MTAMSDAFDTDRPYDRVPGLGTLYDATPAYAARGDVAFYVDAARRQGGRVLELGCGTGRITLPIARAGLDVVGLDGSDEMLAALRAKVAAEPPEVQARITLHRGDARDFALGARFDLVIAPFRILQHLVTLDDQLRCLACVRQHLAPGGRFVFDVFNPWFASLTSDRSAEMPETPPLALADGRRMWRTVRIPRVRWTDQVSETELIYHVADRDGGEETRHVLAFDMRWYLRAELTHLLARAGFRVESVRGNFDGSPLTDTSPEQVVSAVLAEPA